MRVEVGELCLDLTDEQVQSLRRQLAVDSPGEHFLDAAQVAERLGVSREYVYAHAAELGAIRLGGGPRGRLRFDPARIEGKAAHPKPAAEVVEPSKPSRRRRSPRGKQKVELLAVRGSHPYADSSKAAPGGASTPTEGLTKGGVAPMANHDSMVEAS